MSELRARAGGPGAKFGVRALLGRAQKRRPGNAAEEAVAADASGSGSDDDAELLQEQEALSAHGAGDADHAAVQFAKQLQPESDVEDGLTRRQGEPLPYDSEALRTLLYNAAWRKAEDGGGAGEATARELLRTVELPLRLAREGSTRALVEQLAAGKKSALDGLELEFNAQSKILERKAAAPEALLGRVAATAAKLLADQHEEAEAGTQELLARQTKEHAEMLTIVRGKTDRMIGELLHEAKEGLHTRHGWKSAEVAKKLEGAQFAARSAAEAEWRAKLEASMSGEARLMQKVGDLMSANQMLTECVTARNADENLVKNSPWYLALLEERDAYMGMVADLEALLAEERRLRVQMEQSGLHNAEDARKLAELRRRLASGAARAQKVEALLKPGGADGLGMSEAQDLAARDRRESNIQISNLKAQLFTLQWKATAAEKSKEAMRAAKEEADAALAQARMDLRRVGGAGAHNPNFPAGVKRGAANQVMRPPLFRTSLTASEAILGLRAEAAAAAAAGMAPDQRRRSRQSSASRTRPGSQLSEPSVAWSEASAASQVYRTTDRVGASYVHTQSSPKLDLQG